MPNFFIDKFRIPPFLLPVYQAAGIEYGVRWEVLAAINEIETDYGRNLNVSSAGALGWMQFMPATWEQYGVDANRDGLKDPFNPVDAIFAAARYLRAAGAETDVRRAIFAYNHADWYVDSVLMRARLIGGLPSNFVGSLTGLTQGRFPVHAKATYAGQIKKGDAKRKTKVGANAAVVVEANADRRGIKIFARRGAARGRRQRRPHRAHRRDRAARQVHPAAGHLRQHLHLRPPRQHPQDLPGAASRARRPRRRSPASSSSRRPTPSRPAPPRRPPAPPRADAAAPRSAAAAPSRAPSARPPPPSSPAAMPAKQRLFAHPVAPQRAWPPAARLQLAERRLRPVRVRPDRPQRQATSSPSRSRRARASSPARSSAASARPPRREDPHVLFELRPAGRGAPRVDPKPILDGWKLLESTAIYRAKGKNPFFGDDAERPSLGQILLMGKEALQPPRARQPAHRHLRLRPPRHPRPARSTAACSPRSSSSPPPASSRPSPR